jgi:hypothetical protein
MENAVFWDVKTQFVLHRRHITSPLQCPATACRCGVEPWQLMHPIGSGNVPSCVDMSCRPNESSSSRSGSCECPWYLSGKDPERGINLKFCVMMTVSVSSAQSSWLLTQRFEVRFRSLPNFLRSSGSVTEST